MKSLYRRALILLVAIVILSGGYVLYRFIAANRATIPQDFSDARSRGGAISEDIVSNSNQVAFDIAHINDGSPKYAQVSSTIGDIQNRVATIRDQAIKLSGELSIMTQALPNVRSAEAQQAALESISQRLALVSRLITYTDEVTRLVAALRLRIEQRVNNTEEISRLVGEVNAEVTAINNFNRAANESMDRFDALLR